MNHRETDLEETDSRETETRLMGTRQMDTRQMGARQMDTKVVPEPVDVTHERGTNEKLCHSIKSFFPCAYLLQDGAKLYLTRPQHVPSSQEFNRYNRHRNEFKLVWKVEPPLPIDSVHSRNLSSDSLELALARIVQHPGLTELHMVSTFDRYSRTVEHHIRRTTIFRRNGQTIGKEVKNYLISASDWDQLVSDRSLFNTPLKSIWELDSLRNRDNTEAFVAVCQELEGFVNEPGRSSWGINEALRVLEREVDLVFRHLRNGTRGGRYR